MQAIGVLKYKNCWVIEDFDGDQIKLKSSDNYDTNHFHQQLATSEGKEICAKGFMEGDRMVLVTYYRTNNDDYD